MFKSKTFQFFLFVIALGAAGWYFRAQLAPFGAQISRTIGKASAPAEAAVYYCPMHPTYTSDRPGDCPICNMKLVKRGDAAGHAEHLQAGEAKTFTVQQIMNMKPGEICLLHKCKMGKCKIAMTAEFARLGKCPHCGENLGVIVKEASPDGYMAVNLGEENQEAIGVETAPVEKKLISKTIRTAGRIARDPELFQAQEEYIQSVNAFRRAETTGAAEIREQAAQLVESAKIKLRVLGLSDDLITAVEAAGKADRSLLYSDAGGTVWLYAPVYEYELSLVKVGDVVDVEAPSFPGKKFQGKIRSIDSTLDPNTRSVRVRAILDNPEGLLKPEMYVNASLKIDAGENLVVPDEAVFLTGDKNIVFVAKDKNHFEPREVTLGTKLDKYYEVKSGLQEGELVVTSGNFLIDSESRLKAALQDIGSGSAQGHQHGS